MSEKLYRVDIRKGLKRSTLLELSEMKFCIIRTAKPLSENVYIGEWFCWNDDCVAGEITIQIELYGEPNPAPKCPVCQGVLEFLNFIEHETLVPVEKPS